MPSLHRIQWIDASIRNGEYPNATKVAYVFEISKRQALRDFEYLRDSLGAPLKYSSEHKGFYYTQEYAQVPSIALTPAQRELAACLADHYKLLSQTQTVSEELIELANLLSRLSGQDGVSTMPRRALLHGLVPFRAILTTPLFTTSVPTSLKPYFRGRLNDNQTVFEFYDSTTFIAALLASGIMYTVEFPNWLRGKVVYYLDCMRHLNQS